MAFSLEKFWWLGSMIPKWDDWESEIWNPHLKELVDRLNAVAEAGDIRTPFNLRDELRQKYGFAILNRNAVEAILPYSPLLDAGAGTGYYAEMLRRCGADILAVENQSTEFGFFYGDETVTEVLHPYNGTDVLDADAVAEIPKHPERNLFLCWPDCFSSFASECLTAFQGAYVVYIGEGDGGCTGDDAFHEMLESEFSEIKTVDIPQWYGLHDYLSIYRRKE